MALLVITQDLDPQRFTSVLERLAPERDVRVWPDAGDAAEIRYALAWKPPAGALRSFPGLEVIFSIGAGVDHLLTDPELPALPVVRFVDPNLTMRMTEYVVLHTLLHHRRMLEYAAFQRASTWREVAQPGADEVRVGVMGLGVLGRDAAEKLAGLGFQVAGWSRAPKTIAGATCFAGADGLDAFLARTDVLVCLLPLTDDTRGILNRALLAGLARDGALPGPALINAGRGGLQVETDILAALEAGELGAASLDVFETEPLPATSPLWSHPRVIVTPHNASISDERAVCRYTLAQIDRYEAGGTLENLVDVGRGY